MKMVIADDESLVRATLKSMVKDMEASWQIVGEATNGEELLEMIEYYKPNIVISDIRMPKMDGLEAIRRGKTISPMTSWIILSGFSDFSYAQQALTMGVSDYLLKPIDPLELEKTLNLIYRNNKEYITLLNRQFENNVFALCHGLTSLKQEERSTMFYQGEFVAWTFHFDQAEFEFGNSSMQQSFYEELRSCMEEQLAFGMNLALLALPSGDLAAIGAWDSGKDAGARRSVYGFFEKLGPIIERYQSSNCYITVMQTGDCEGFESVLLRLEELQNWAELRSVCGIGKNLDYEELKRNAADEGKMEAARLLCACGLYAQEDLYLNYNNTVNELEKRLKQAEWLAGANTHAIYVYSTVILRRTKGDYQALPLHEYGEAKLFVQKLMQELRQGGEEALRAKSVKSSESGDIVKEVIRYIEQYYMDDIGVGQIAGLLNVSPNYLSGQFHKKTGIMFVKYLVRIRMLKAKELLMDTNLQVKQVAEQVGYHSTRHFTKLFIQSFGKYPSDFRKTSSVGAEM
ncbi:response regulator [Paenibacillus sp. NPDC058071]|uniref:response regulator transcription factor n=1 Tax=Paenibacillus sp. NPDC058071 TaxID=3346326 RepID=UPI0036D88F8D